MGSLLGAPDVKADAIVGVGDGTEDGLVPLTGQAPLTGTPVVNPVDGLQRWGGGGGPWSQSQMQHLGYLLFPTWL